MPATPANRGQRRWKPLLRSFRLQSLALLAVIVGLDYWPVLLRGMVPLPMDVVFGFPLFASIAGSHPVNGHHAEMGDLVSGVYSLHLQAASAVSAGTLGLWNAHLLAGQPFFGAYASGMLYPLNWLYYALPTHLAWALLYPVRMLLAAWFMALFVRSLGASRTGSVVSGLAYGFSGFLLTWSGWPQVDAALWLPLICLAIQKVWERPTPRRAALVALALAPPLLVGHPQTEAYVLAMAALFALWRVLTPVHSDRWFSVRLLGLLLLAGVLALLVVAVQLLPAQEWIGLTTRATQNRGGNHLARVQSLGVVSRDTRGTPNSAGILIPEGATYLGMLPLLAAPFALMWARRRDVVLFVGSGLTAALVAYGAEPLFRTSTRLPVFGRLPTWRVEYLSQFCLAVLAGLGVTVLQRLARERRLRAPQRTGWWAALVVEALVGAVALRHLSDNTLKPVRWFRGPTSSVLLLLVVLILLTPVVLSRLPRSTAAAAVLGLVAVDLLSYGYGHVPFVRPRDVYPQPRAFAELAARDHGVYRVTSVSGTYITNLELAYGLATPSGVGYQIRTVAPLLTGLGSALSGYVLDAKKIVAADDRRLDLLNTKYLFATTENDSAQLLAAHPGHYRLVLTDGTVRVYQNLQVLPRAFVVDRSAVRSVATAAEGYAAAASRSFDPEHSAVVLGPVSTVRPRRPAGAPSVGVVATDGVRSIRYADAGEQVDVGVAASRPGVLVLSDVTYPGWQVRVDGRRRALLRVDGGLKGVAVVPGDRAVRFSFHSTSVGHGLDLTGLGLLGVLVCLLFPQLHAGLQRWPARHRRPAPPRQPTRRPGG